MAPDHTVPYGTSLFRHAFPGTACQATIGMSLRDVASVAGDTAQGILWVQDGIVGWRAAGTTLAIPFVLSDHPKNRRGFQDGRPLRNAIPYSAASLTRSGISGSPLLNASAQAAKKRSKPPGTRTTATAASSFPVTLGACGIPCPYRTKSVNG